MLQKLNTISLFFKGNKSKIYCLDNSFFISEVNSKIKKTLDECEIKIENLAQKNKLNIWEYLNVELISFADIEKYFDKEFINQEFVILSETGDFCYQIQGGQIEYSPACEFKFKTKCGNKIAQNKLLNVITSENFSDHYDSSSNEVIFYSSINGIVKIKLDLNNAADENIDCSKVIDELLETCKLLILKSFFINSLFIVSKQSGILTFNEVVLKADEIDLITKRNYELVAKQFDFEKFKNSLYKEKEKYFTNIREIVSKISSQVISIPISISAAVFSTYKVSDDIIMLFMVMLSFIIYTYFYIRIQFFYKKDLIEIQNDFNRDFQIIQDQSGLPTDIINIEKQKIKRKIADSIKLINLLLFIVFILSLLVSMYILYEIFKSNVSVFTNSIFFQSFISIKL